MRILYKPHEYSQQRQREKKACIYPIRLAMEATYYAQNKENEVHWITSQGGKYNKIISEPEGLPFLSLPAPDRTLTMAQNKIYQSNGNFKSLPGTYILSASGCWWGKCSFCVENGQPYEVRPVEDVIEELYECEALGFKEVFDDSATFPTDIKWLRGLASGVPRWEQKEVLKLGCNMRICDVDFHLLKLCGFRMVLFGIESANQYTLDRINKGVKVEDIIPCIKRAADCGLEPHIAVMYGYSWETEQDARKTFSLVHYLLRKGYAKTAQASLYSPQGVPGNEAHKKYVKKIYNAAYCPEFWWVRRNEDIKYIWRGVQAWLKR